MLHYLENADSMSPQLPPTKKEQLATFTSNLVQENMLTVSLKNAYYRHILIQKEKWLSFISDKKRANEICDSEILLACFDVISGLPMRKQIKHDLHLLTAKILEAQINLGLEPNFEVTWNCPNHETMQKVNYLQQLIEAEAKENKVNND